MKIKNYGIINELLLFKKCYNKIKNFYFYFVLYLQKLYNKAL